MTTRLRRFLAGIWGLPIAGLIGVTWVFAIGVLALGLCIVAGLVGIDTENSPTVPQAVTAVLAVMTAFGLAAALVVNARRQELAESADLREMETVFTTRFREGTSLLSADGQAERLAGVYALTALAEEYPNRAVLCADVLCGYLRIEKLPATHSQFVVQYEGPQPDPEPYEIDESIWSAIRADLEVRFTIERELARLTRGPGAGGGPWSHLQLNLSRSLLINFTLIDCVVADLVLDYAVLIDKTDFSKADIGTFSAIGTRFNGPTWWSMTSLGTTTTPIIETAEFAAESKLSGLRLPKGARLAGCHFHGEAAFEGLESAQVVEFINCHFDGNTTFEDANFDGQGVIFQHCRFKNGRVTFDRASARASNFENLPGLDLENSGANAPNMNSRVTQ